MEVFTHLNTMKEVKNISNIKLFSKRGSTKEKQSPS